MFNGTSYICTARLSIGTKRVKWHARAAARGQSEGQERLAALGK